VKAGAVPFAEVTSWAAALRDELAEAAATTQLPGSPDLEVIDRLLLRVREEGLS
jgi:hypothetical protein